MSDETSAVIRKRQNRSQVRTTVQVWFKLVCLSGNDAGDDGFYVNITSKAGCFSPILVG